MSTTSAAPGEPLSFLIMRGENANVQVRKGDRILGTHRVTGTVRASDLDAAAAHERLEKQTINGRLVLRP